MILKELITTTGYEDILPNSRTIRTLVVFETFFLSWDTWIFYSTVIFKGR